MNFFKRTGKVFALVLALSMLMTTAVFAEEPATEDDYVVTYSVEEVTDVDELIAMALEQKAEQPQTKARSAMPAEDNGQLNVTQVLEVREYADGTVEKDAVSSGLLILDTCGKMLSDRSLRDLTVREDQTKYTVTAFHQMYYTYSTDTDRPSGKLNKICTQINSNPNGRIVTIMQCYNINPNWGEQEDTGYETISNAQTNRTYYLYANSNAFIVLNRPSSGIASSAELTVSGYGTFTLSVNASAPMI